jgi:hypothetical protein
MHLRSRRGNLPLGVDSLGVLVFIDQVRIRGQQNRE